MALDHITDHVAQAQALLISQYKNKPRIAAMVASWGIEGQAVEDALYDVILLRLVDAASGVQLDAIGRVVGELRRARVDATYRLYLAARIRINRSQGQAGDLIAVLAIVETAPYTFGTYATANVVVEFVTIPTQDPLDLVAMLRDTKMAGVGLLLIAPTDSVNDFLFSNAGDADVAANSFGDSVTPDGQGLLSCVYR